MSGQLSNSEAFKQEINGLINEIKPIFQAWGEAKKYIDDKEKTIKKIASTRKVLREKRIEVGIKLARLKAKFDPSIYGTPWDLMCMAEFGRSPGDVRKLVKIGEAKDPEGEADRQAAVNAANNRAHRTRVSADHSDAFGMATTYVEQKRPLDMELLRELAKMPKKDWKALLEPEAAE